MSIWKILSLVSVQVPPPCWNQMLPMYSYSIFLNKNSFNLARLRNGHSFLILEEKLPNYASGLKSVPNSDSSWMHREYMRARFLCINATTFVLFQNYKNVQNDIEKKCKTSWFLQVLEQWICLFIYGADAASLLPTYTFCNLMSLYFPALFKW